VHFVAVIANRVGDRLALLQWHRAKAGAVERTHSVRKNESAAAALPSGKFGANAWCRLDVLTHNLPTALTRLLFPGDFRTAPADAVAILVFNAVEKVIAYARRTPLRLSGVLQHAFLIRVRRKIVWLAAD
jgi:hypothetical protein